MYTIKLRRDTSARWARLNPVLEFGEPGVERTPEGLEKFKIGDGETPWNDLDYIAGGDGAGIGPRGPQGIPGPDGPVGPAGPRGLKGDKGDPGPAGPQGATGTAGPQGIRGLQGLQGPRGSDGQSFNYRGDWDSATIFAVDDVTFHNGSSWIARIQNSNSEPSGTSDDWDEIAIAGAQGPPGPAGADGLQGATGPQGPRGNPGPQGLQGSQGSPGPKGDAGATGPQGIQGPLGDPGPAGPTGATGSVGPAGADGATGPQGVQGPRGLQGIQGDPGPAGADGPQGPRGIQGLKGDTGDPGPAGVDGAQGPAGPRGIQGLKGDTGDPGPQGAQGPRGFQGVAGATGPAGPTGDQGPQGVAGPAGSDGHSFNYQGTYDPETAYVVNDVVFFNGSTFIAVAPSTGSAPSFSSTDWDEIAIQGAQGAPGVDGSQGPAGPAGAAGPQGPQGPAGSQGPAGPKGDTGAVGAQGPAGAAGAQGPAGAAGAAGPAGADGAQGPAGVQGPKGDTGNTGATGAQGPQGIQGPTGPAGSTQLSGLTDVDLTGIADGKVLGYVAAAAKWKAVTPSGGSGGSSPAAFVGARLTHSVSQTNSPLAFDTTVYDTGGFMVAANKFTAPAAGKYMYVFHGEAADHVDDTDRYWTLRKNGATNLDDAFIPRGGAGAGMMGVLQLNAGDTLDILATNIPTSTLGSERDLHFEIVQLSAPAVSGAAADRNVTAASSVDITGLDPTVEAWDVYVDGVLAQGGTARWVGIWPNSIAPVNPGNVMRGTLTREWTDLSGNVQQPTTLRSDEHGLVLGALPFTTDQVISAFAHIRSKKDGNARVARTQMATGAVPGANVNETSDHQASTRWDNTASDLTSLKVDFGGGTFTGRVIVMPSKSIGAASVTVQGDDAWTEVDLNAQSTYTIPNFPTDKKGIEIELDGRLAGTTVAYVAVQPQGTGTSLNSRNVRKFMFINAADTTGEGVSNDAGTQNVGFVVGTLESTQVDTFIEAKLDFARTGVGKATASAKRRDVSDNAIVSHEYKGGLSTVAQPTSVLVKFNQGNACTFTGKLRYRFKS